MNNKQPAPVLTFADLIPCEICHHVKVAHCNLKHEAWECSICECDGYIPDSSVVANSGKVTEPNEAQREMHYFRARVFTARARPGSSDHCTACTIWGDNGLGGTIENYPEPLPCNCGALENYQHKLLLAAQATIVRLQQELLELRELHLADESSIKILEERIKKNDTRSTL